MSELREMHLSELLTILAEVPGDRLDHFNSAIRMAKNCEAERSALLRERDEAVKTLEATSNALSDLLHHGAWYPETGETHQANPDAAMIALNTARTFLAAQGSSTNTNSEP